jgi:prephenate dehydrogenase
VKEPIPSRTTELANLHVAVVGLGLMGSSLAGALRGQCQRVTAVARRRATIEMALDRGWIDQGTTDLPSGVHAADVVILATPVRVILRLLDQIGPLTRAGCLVMDLGSTKAQIIAKMAGLPDHVQPIGGHPMCGKEVSGIEAADPAIYQHCTFLLTPLPRTSKAALALSSALVEAVGAQPLVLDPHRHDRLVATASHLPYVLACSLVDTAESVAANDPSVWQVCASGFRDTSRLAASDVTMMLDILLTNREAVVEALTTYKTRLRDLATLIESANEVELRGALAAIRERRVEM